MSTIDLDQKCAMYLLMGRNSRVRSRRVAVHVKRALAASIRDKMAAEKISTSAFARKIGTGRAAVRRILDPVNTSVTLNTIARAAEVLGLEIILRVRALSLSELATIADRYVAAEDPAEAARLEDKLVSGYYGRSVSATRMRSRHAEDPAQKPARGRVPSPPSTGTGKATHGR